MIGPVVSEEQIFEKCGRRTDEQRDDVRTAGRTAEPASTIISPTSLKTDELINN